MRKKSEKELFIIDGFKNGMSRKEMASQLGVEVFQINYYIKKNFGKQRFEFNEEENEFMREHYMDMTYKEIAKQLGYTERQIRGRINNMGLIKVRQINDHYFDEIDTPLKAYFLGFIFADGYICLSKSERNAEFGMELQYVDRYILEKLNDELGGLNQIYDLEPEDCYICGVLRHKNKSSVLRVYSKNIVLGLMSNGIERNKTLKRTYPVVSDELFFDFLRGYIDGDGCYWINNDYTYMHITCATDSILSYIQNKLLQDFNITTHIYKEHDKKYRLICISIEEMKKLIPLLYYDSNVFCLKRKYEKIKSYLNNGSAA